MSVLGISTMGSYQSQFQQIGKDLQAGNMTAAKQDFAEMTTKAGGMKGGYSSWNSQVFSTMAQTLKIQTASGTTGTTAAGTLQKDISSLGQALQGGNLTAAKQAYSQMQQDYSTIQSYARNHSLHSSLTPAQAVTKDSNNSLTSTSTTSKVSNFVSSALSLFSAIA